MSHFDRKGMYLDYVRRVRTADAEVCTSTAEPEKRDNLTMEKLLEAAALINPLKGNTKKFMRDMALYGSATWRTGAIRPWDGTIYRGYHPESNVDIGPVRKGPMTATEVRKAKSAGEDLLDAAAINYSKDLLGPYMDKIIQDALTRKPPKPEILAAPNVDKKNITERRQAVIMQGGYEMTPTEAEALARQLQEKAKEVRKFNAGPYVRPFKEKL